MIDLLFCAEPFARDQIDKSYQAEAEAANANSLIYALLDYEALVNDQNSFRAIGKVAAQFNPQSAIYRGWMLKPAFYKMLYRALQSRNYHLINDPQAYQHCHYLPEWYALLEQHTPRSVWLKFDADFSIDQLEPLLASFGNKPLILKDYVKSRKHEWLEACFIPDASDITHVQSVVSRFLALQGADLNEGLVFREFVEFEPLAAHSKSGMPLTKEFRIFFYKKQPLYWTAYWDEGTYTPQEPLPLEHFTKLAQLVQSNFFTMDVARTLSGQWQIIELGDGQVSGLPANADLMIFYKTLANHI